MMSSVSRGQGRALDSRWSTLGFPFRQIISLSFNSPANPRKFAHRNCISQTLRMKIRNRPSFFIRNPRTLVEQRTLTRTGRGLDQKGGSFFGSNLS